MPPARTGEKASGIVETDYYSFVDGLRGVAILMVVLGHTMGEDLPPASLLGRVAGAGSRGVQLFFILSAFTLYSSSLQRFAKEAHPRRNFYLRRAFRILPMWWLALLLVFLKPVALEPGDAPPDLLNLLLHAVFLFGFAPAYVNSLLQGGWSLFCEETFYLLLPFVQKRAGDARAAASLTLALLGIAVGWHLAARSTIGALGPAANSFVFFFPLSQWFIFGLGILYFHVFKAAGPAFLQGPAALLADAFALAGLWAALVGAAPGPMHWTSSFALFGFCCAVSQRDSALRRLVDTQLLRLFGRCCYSIYLFHILLIATLRPYRARIFELAGLATAGAGVHFAAWSLLVGGICLALGLLSFYAFEKPFVMVGRRLVRSLEAREA